MALAFAAAACTALRPESRAASANAAETGFRKISLCRTIPLPRGEMGKRCS